MTFLSTDRAVRSSLATVAIALGIGLAGCGGGSDDLAAVQAAPESKVAASAVAIHVVTVQGCVVDRHYIPTTGAPVRVLAADGRLLGHAFSDGDGRFSLRLPANSTVMLQIDRPEGESMPMRVDPATTQWERCLLDERA